MNILSRLLLVAFTVALLASPALADGKKFALLVGVTEYEHAGLGDLKYSENDAEELAKLLQKDEAAFAEVVVLSTSRGKSDEKLKPTAKNIREQLKRLSGLVTKHDVLLVGLAGHGLQISITEPNSDKERNESFFCPSDARPKNSGTLEELKETMIPMLELFKELDDSGAGMRLLLVDACRNELKAGSRNFDVDTLPKPGKGTAVLFSCKGGEKAFESDKLGKGHGIFFYNVIEALKGKATTDKGEITWTRLAEYVTEKVADEVPGLVGGGAQQTPHEIKNFEGKPPVLMSYPIKPAVLEQQGEEGPLPKSIPEPQPQPQPQPLAGEVGPQPKADVKQETPPPLVELGPSPKADDPDPKVDPKPEPKVDPQPQPQPQPEAKADEGYLQAIDLLFGLKAQRDPARAVELLQQASERGSVPAKGLLGWATVRGQGLAANAEAGEKLLRESMAGLREAADRGDVGSMFVLASLHQTGVIVEQDREAARKLALVAAEKDFAPAMRLLAGLANADKNHEVEAEWNKKAADLGYVPSMVNLGDCYARGRGVKRDDKKAVAWFRKAADAGDADATYFVARAYAFGLGVEQNEKQAMTWYIAAGKKGNVEALYQVAYRVEMGRGVEANVCDAVKLYAHAAEQGSTDATARLGYLYLTGKGVKKDYTAARAWHGKAAKQGHAPSMFALGLIYENGLGVKMDCTVAKRWYTDAAKSGYKPAIDKLAR